MPTPITPSRRTSSDDKHSERALPGGMPTAASPSVASSRPSPTASTRTSISDPCCYPPRTSSSSATRISQDGPPPPTMTSMLNGFKTAVSSETDLLQAKQLKIIQEMEEQARELAAKAKVVRMWQKRLEEAALEAKETADRWQLSSRELSRTAGEQAIAILKPVDAEEMLREAAAVEKRKAISADDRSDVSASSSTMRRSAATRLLKIPNVLKALTG